jgi:hypothetical protein
MEAAFLKHLPELPNWIPLVLAFLIFGGSVRVYLKLERWLHSLTPTPKQILTRINALTGHRIALSSMLEGKLRPIFEPDQFDDLHDWLKGFPGDMSNPKARLEFRIRCFRYKLKLESCLLSIAAVHDPTVLERSHAKKRPSLDLIVRNLENKQIFSPSEKNQIMTMIAICNRGRHVENSFPDTDVRLLYEQGRPTLDLAFSKCLEQMRALIAAAEEEKSGL